MLWKNYFRDPSQWWDKRCNKAGPAFPDFEHKITGHSLWIHGRFTPSWVLGELRITGAFPNDVVSAYVSLLRACAKNSDLSLGVKIHKDIQKKGLLHHCSDDLIIMYAKCGALEKARHLLETHKSKHVFSWTSLIAGYVRKGQCQDALAYFEKMQAEGLSPDAVTFGCFSKTCGTIRSLDKNEKDDADIGLQCLSRDNVKVGNKLVDIYTKSGAFANAQQMVNGPPMRNAAAWSSLIQSYAGQGQYGQALECFKQMQQEGISPNARAIMCLLKSCSTIGDADYGDKIHNEINKKEPLKNDKVLGTAVVDMYAKCGATTKAQQVFDGLHTRDIISWNALIAGYAQQGQGEQALECFENMKNDGISPNSVTFLSILKACGNMEAAEEGKRFHVRIVGEGLHENNIVLGNALIDMYAKCGKLEKSLRVLQELPNRDFISWSALIAGYAKQGQAEQAIEAFEKMQQEGFPPNKIMFLCMLKACSSMQAADRGEQIHGEIARQGLLMEDHMLCKALVDMYVKCGALGMAKQVLDEFPTQNVASWNALIAGYIQEGECRQALKCFQQMESKGLFPDARTFMCVLKVCGLMGLMEDAENYFGAMHTKYDVCPDLSHYTCIVGAFGNAGLLEKAAGIVQQMPCFEHPIAVWLALLGACQKWAYVKLGKWAFEKAVKIDNSHATAYILMANIYRAAGMLENAKMIEAMKIKNNTCKPSLCAGA
ncbi:hypothetical protein KP509_20G079700 [Ceratopteris richardii]|nr:hypothetical protein KP509_20G079700 [Ceratopteris richardii]